MSDSQEEGGLYSETNSVNNAGLVAITKADQYITDIEINQDNLDNTVNSISKLNGLWSHDISPRIVTTLCASKVCGILVRLLNQFSNQEYGIRKWLFSESNIWTASTEVFSSLCLFSKASSSVTKQLLQTEILTIIETDLRKNTKTSFSKNSKIFYVIKAHLSILKNFTDAMTSQDRRKFSKILGNYVSMKTNISAFAICVMGFLDISSLPEKEAFSLVECAYLKNGNYDIFFTSTDFLQVLYLKSMSASICMFSDKVVLQFFQNVLKRGEIAEKILVAKIMWACSMNLSLKEAINKIDDLIKTMRKLEVDASSDRELVETLNGALWNLRDRHSRKREPIEYLSSKHSFVFVVYQNANLKEVEILTKFLSNESLDVVTNRSTHYDCNKFKYLATAVEKSSSIILCFSESFQKDLLCRHVTHYAQTFKKTFNIQVEKHFQPLDLLTNRQKVFQLNETSLRDLLQNLGKPKSGNGSPNSMISSSGYNSMSSLVSSPSTSESSDSSWFKDHKQQTNKISLLTKSGVSQWLRDNNLSECLRECRHIDGRMLWQLKLFCDNLESSRCDHFLKEFLFIDIENTRKLNHALKNI